MIYDFTERKQILDQVERSLMDHREEYMAPKMSRAQLRRLKEEIGREKRRQKLVRLFQGLGRVGVTAAALAGVFLILPNTSAVVAHAMEQLPLVGQWVKVVTIRDYQLETDRNHADVQIAEIGVDGSETESIQMTLEQTVDRINEEIQSITGELISEFEKNMADEMGYQDLVVRSEILTRTEDYFTIKLFCYQGSGSGYQWNYYYTIDLHTGERLKLKDLFVEDAAYITAISEEIKRQMQKQMEEDEMVRYWLHDEIEAWNFKSITDETSFYVNEAGNVVIGFNEGDVAPMYMGAVEFEIPTEVLSDIRK